MPLLSALFSTPEMDQVLCDELRVQGILEFEAALARALGALGLIPEAVVTPIDNACHEFYGEYEFLAGLTSSGNLAIPVIAALTRRVKESNAEAARYVHWGATSQDALDTGLVLTVRSAERTLARDHERLEAALAKMADGERGTVLAGRTWLQQAVPTTLGLKAAGWLDALSRAGERLHEAIRALSVVQLGGAAGTLASLGKSGPKVTQALAKELSLGVPELPWHTARQRVVDVGCALGVLLGVLGKIARDVSLLVSTEVAELVLGAGGGSSAMPQKKNPVGCAVVLAAATRAPGLVATLLAAMPQEHERGLGNWLAEWETLPDLFRLAAGALANMADTMENVTPDPQAMHDNLSSLVMAESVSVALAETLGKSAAHAVVQRASARVVEGEDFAAALLADEAVSKTLAEGDVRALLAPENYLGSANAYIDAALHAASERKKRREQR